MDERDDATRGTWLCSAAMVLVGSTVVASRLLGDTLDPFLATLLRHLLALPVFLLLMHWRRVPWPRPGRRDAGLLLVQALAGSVGYTVLLIEGVRLCGPGDAGVVAGTLPTVAAVFSVLVLRERPGWRLAVAVLLATLGVLALTLSPPSDAAPPARRLLGIGLVLAAVACEAVFILANKRLATPIDALALSTLMSAGGLLLSALPAGLALAAGGAGAMPSATGWAAIAYYALGPTVVGFLLWYAGSVRTSGVRASLTTAWLPVSAVLLSAAVLGEPVGVPQALGLALVVAAVLLAGRPSGGSGRARAARRGPVAS